MKTNKKAPTRTIDREPKGTIKPEYNPSYGRQTPWELGPINLGGHLKYLNR